MTEQIHDLGVIVNDREGVEPSNNSSNYNLDEAVVPLRMPHSILDRLQNAAEFHGYPSLESYCMARLIETLDRKVGQAYIDSPSQYSGMETRKISGPSGLGMVSRA